MVVTTYLGFGEVAGPGRTGKVCVFLLHFFVVPHDYLSSGMGFNRHKDRTSLTAKVSTLIFPIPPVFGIYCLITSMLIVQALWCFESHQESFFFV